MRKVLSTTALTIVLAAFLCIGFSEQCRACTDCMCFTDESCSNNSCDGNLTANCFRSVFSPNCTGTYTFRTFTTCIGEAKCENCRSCANLFQFNGVSEVFVANNHSDQCDNGDCTSSTTVFLDNTKTYVMYICKIPCPNGSTCEDCTEDCNANACLSIGLSTSQCTP